MYRIIPCLDIVNGKVVKGKKFKDMEELEDPSILAQKYSRAGASEIVFYDISASIEGRTFNYDYIKEAIGKLDIPFCLGGGISNVDDIGKALEMGASKVSINSQALRDKNIIKEGSEKFGRDKIVLAMDVKKNPRKSWNVYVKGGKEDTGIDAIEWAKEGERLGAGELIINSIDGDGMKDGYDIGILRRINEVVDIPIVASGGAGKMEDFYNGITLGKASGVLAASVFHYGEIEIAELKKYLSEKDIPIK